MKTSEVITEINRRPMQANLFVATVTEVVSGGYQLDHCFSAQRAVCCLIEPLVQDRVLVIQDNNCYYIHQILSRAVDAPMFLSSPGSDSLNIHASKLSLSSIEQTQIQSIGDVEILSCSGKVSLIASQLFLNAFESLVQLCRNLVQRAVQVDTEAEALIRTHGHHQLMTARQDIKIDAERINMG